MAKADDITVNIDAPAAYPGAALEAAIRAARLSDPIIKSHDGRDYVLVPHEFSLKEVPDDTRLSPFPKQRVTVDERASLSAYANRFSSENSIIIADYDTLTISARLDWHKHNEAVTPGLTGSEAHSVTLKLRPSEEFSRWNAFIKEGFTDQETFARFLEENSGDVYSPDPSTLIEISRDFEATSGQSYKSSVRLDNGDRKILFETDTRAVNDVIIPQEITLLIPFYNGEEPSQIKAKFRWRPSNGAVVFALEWHRVEYHRRAHFTAIAYQAAEETGLPVFIGRQG